ncbi:mandelate racemase/muconate lactonizing enzyme family protein [Xenophilus arseniciresistens]|uniref:Mandelate racemase/muconate lactonizing enzyme family protein n=1 Tax=Xenophilus arseniciresistens TaxID=1283306 RepID=A0AAE3N6B5_9BURK|nr:mandelate racemase/muconate lactonizing enzyme family protein [Xenophilus arseniciresistens]MDA7416395.1 mandelate racemase/muconate lactonizing enzyme family protein [Xenophilus arseniciresistens]
MTLPSLPTPALTPARIDAHVFRHPIRTPVRTSFGVMHDRPALFVRVQDDDGAAGWGEVWCNFPGCGAEHRARLIDTVLAPLLLGQHFQGPAEAWKHLSERTAVLAIQSGEPGPLAQAIAGIDLALWDLSARRAGQPLWRHLGGTRSRVPVYASGINPDAPEQTALRCRAQGYRAFKLKIGFGEERDLANLDAMRRALGDATPLMVDANQGWSLDEALHMAERLRPYGLQWLEEPLRADRPWHEWQALQAATSIALAGGENIAGAAAFDVALQARVFSVLQPDAAKWGGISANWEVIQRGQAAGLRYCPHYLGAGVGLLASAHLLAAAGGEGMLEVDANDNPLRTALSPAAQHIDGEGCIDLGEAPGIGVLPDPAQIARLVGRAGN